MSFHGGGMNSADISIPLATPTLGGDELQKEKGLFNWLSEAPEVFIEIFLPKFAVLHDLLINLERETTMRTTAAILFNTSQFLREVFLALRAVEFKNFIVEYPHSFSSVGIRSVELPILPTSKKLPIGEKE